MDWKAIRKAILNPVGFRLAGIYLILVLVIFLLTAATTKPSKVGLDWIPFLLLSWPWLSWQGGTQCLLPGLLVNAGILYFVGTLFRALWCRLLIE